MGLAHHALALPLTQVPMGRLSCMQGWSESFLQTITRQNKHTVYESWYRRGAQHTFTELQIKLFEKTLYIMFSTAHSSVKQCCSLNISSSIIVKRQFPVWKQCLSTSRFSSTSSNWQLRPQNAFLLVIGTEISHTVPHILIDHDEHDVSRAPVLSLLPSHIARFHLKPFHFTCSFLIKVWGSPFAPLLGATDRRIDCVHAHNMH